MKVICDRCGTDHQVDAGYFHDPDRGTLVCRGCRTHIRVYRCSRCAAPYLTAMDEGSPSLCPLCRREIRLRDDAVKEKGPDRSPGGSLPVEKSNLADETPFLKAFTTGTGGKGGNKSYLHFPYLKTLFPGELARVAGEAVRLHTLGPSLLGAWIMMFISALSVPFAGSGDFLAAVPSGRVFLHLFPLPLYLLVYSLTGSIVARYILQRLFTGSVNPEGSGVFLLRAMVPLCIFNGAVTLGAMWLLLLPARLPSVGPLYFGLLIVPLYCLSLLFLFLTLAGIWFIPALVAHRGMTLKGMFQALGGFLARSGFTLCYIVPVMILTGHLIITPLVMIHRGAISLVMGSGDMLTGRTVSDVMGAVPVSIGHAVSSILPLGLQGLLSSFPVLSDAASAGGVFAAAGLWIVTVLCLGLSMSLVSVMGTHVYVFMERGGNRGENRSVFPVVLLALCVIALFAFRRYFP